MRSATAAVATIAGTIGAAASSSAAATSTLAAATSTLAAAPAFTVVQESKPDVLDKTLAGMKDVHTRTSSDPKLY